MDSFTWRDGDRTVHFGRGRVAEAPALLGDDYVLLTTARGRSAAPEVVANATSVHDVPSGLVEDLTVALLDEVPASPSLIVALGGGRVVDTAKAVAAMRGVRAGAIPTTLSSAEMTWIHRLPADAPPQTRRVRPAVVINDPALSASQPPAELAASAGNSLAHAIEGAVTTMSSPVPRLVAAEAIRLTAQAYAGDEVDDEARDALALAALLSGSTIDSSWYGLHHVMAQSLVRGAGAAHGPANAAMLPHTAAALAERRGGVTPESIELARDIAARAGASRLRDIGVDRDVLPAVADAAAGRGELDHTPPRPTRDELLALYEAAW
jgi:alcohol dehydrogenase class IV